MTANNRTEPSCSICSCPLGLLFPHSMVKINKRVVNLTIVRTG